VLTQLGDDLLRLRMLPHLILLRAEALNVGGSLPGGQTNAESVVPISYVGCREV
jgi:hypothetical protein